MGPQWGPAMQGTSTHRAGARWGCREQPGSFLAQPGLPADSALVCVHVSVVSLCSFYMCCCCSLSLFTPLPSSAIPNFPAPGTHLPARSWRSRSAGARPLPHPPSRGVCPALPSVLPFCTNRWPGSLAGRGAIKEWGRRGCSQPQGPAPHPSPGMSKQFQSSVL